MLELLCALLLVPLEAPPDEQGLRYLRWVCRHLQGGRPGRRSPYHQVYTDALKGVRAAQRRQAMASGRAPPQPQASQRPLPQLLSSIAGAVAP